MSIATLLRKSLLIKAEIINCPLKQCRQSIQLSSRIVSKWIYGGEKNLQREHISVCINFDGDFGEEIEPDVSKLK
jgi:hypothetical protein